MGSAVDLLEQAGQDDETHGHLHRECPWFRHVDEGGGDDIETHCQPAWPGGEPPEPHGPPRLVVKLTPRTPEASTVPQPTVPPGGPGLFHVKGLQLPPYVQHLYRHLVGRYGKHDAYRVAVGVVKKWAQGVNPGGWPTKSGKGKKTHPDVQAAAQKNVAEWEEDKAKGHAQHESHGDHASHDKAAATAVLLVARITAPGADAYGPNVVVAGPKPPLPPAMPLPTPGELRQLASQVPPGEDAFLSSSVRKHLTTAAVKLEKDAPLEALALLRSAQAGIYAAHKADLGVGRVTANVFIVTPAQGTVAIAETREKSLAWRRLDLAVTDCISRIRKNFFHGRIFAGPTSPVRLSARLR